MELTDKVALVTGAGSGIGKASAVLFARQGAKVGVLGHTESEVKKVSDEIRAAGGQAIPLVADIADSAQMEKAVQQLVGVYERLDIVYANAGINGTWASIDQLTLDDWNRTINNNLTGTFLTIKHAVPHLKKQGGGSIIVTSSVNGTRIFSNSGATAYATSKAGQVALTKMLALELARDNIRVNVICPGAVDTNISDSTEKKDVDKVKIKADYEEPYPLAGKPATSEQVADLALFLASDASAYITGTPVWIDGAQSLLRG